MAYIIYIYIYIFNALVVGLASFGSFASFAGIGRAGTSEVLSLGVRPHSLQKPALPLKFRLRT